MAFAKKFTPSKLVVSSLATLGIMLSVVVAAPVSAQNGSGYGGNTDIHNDISTTVGDIAISIRDVSNSIINVTVNFVNNIFN